jgi:hypothetical protein
MTLKISIGWLWPEQKTTGTFLALNEFGAGFIPEKLNLIDQP